MLQVIKQCYRPNIIYILMRPYRRPETAIHTRSDGRKDSNKSKQPHIGQVFGVLMSVCQAQAFSKLLPKNYTFRIDRAAMFRKNNFQRKALNRLTTERKVYQQFQGEIFQENSSASKPGTVQFAISSQQILKRGKKILGQLKKNKNAWPFLQPIDPIKMGIQHYFKIVTEPMDLRTVQENLKKKKYTTIAQFYADIELIIKNSMKFNYNNPEFLKTTELFEKAYKKLKEESGAVHTQPIVSPKCDPPISLRIIKPFQKSTFIVYKNDLTLAQKKQMGANLRKLSYEELQELGQILCDGEMPENYQLNLEIMPMEELTIIQKFLDQKQKKGKEQVKKRSQDQDQFKSEYDS